MKKIFAKLSFIHGRLWQRDGAYRVALLLGPAPLFGAAIAVAIWTGVLTFRELTHQPPQWATPSGPETWNTASDQPQAIQPAKPLPMSGADGALAGLQSGWNVVAAPIQVSQTMNVEVKPNSLTGFSIDGPVVDNARILSSGPKAVLYVGRGIGFLVIREPGIYGLSARLERPPAQVANCLVRLGFGQHRVVSNLEINLVNKVEHDYGPAWFDLRPGLYPIAWAFGCWHDQQVIGPGRMSVLVTPPGGHTLSPVRALDIVR